MYKKKKELYIITLCILIADREAFKFGERRIRWDMAW